MSFSDSIKKGIARKSEKDAQLIKSIIATSENDLKFLTGTKITKFSARKIFANYYDVLRSLLEALALNDGYKIYEHQAFTDYLKEKKEPVLAEKFDRLRKIRNGINYYGKDISIEETTEHKEEITKLINIVKEKLLKK